MTGSSSGESDGEGDLQQHGVACLLVDLSPGEWAAGSEGAGAVGKTKQPRVVILVSRGTESLRCEFECSNSDLDDVTTLMPTGQH